MEAATRCCCYLAGAIAVAAVIAIGPLGSCCFEWLKRDVVRRCLLWRGIAAVKAGVTTITTAAATGLID